MELVTELDSEVDTELDAELDESVEEFSLLQPLSDTVSNNRQ